MFPFYLIRTLGSMAHVQKNSQSAAERTKMPKCIDLQIILWGHTPRDRGTLISSGGHDSPDEISPDPFVVKSVGQSSKRTTRDYSINSSRSKKSASIDECLNDITDLIKDHKIQKARKNKQEEEMDKVVKIMKEDGLEESDVVYAKALIICTNTLHRRNFLSMETKQGRINFVQMCWEDRRTRSK